MLEKQYRIRLETRDQRRRVYWLATNGELSQTVSDGILLTADAAKVQHGRVIKTWCRSNLNPPTVKIVPASRKN